MAGKQTPSLDGLIQIKGAPRPSDVPQRGEGPTPSATPASTPSAAPAETTPTSSTARPAVAEPRTKSLTLRLSESQYQRLRRFAFDRDASHQDVIEAALIAHLDRKGG